MPRHFVIIASLLVVALAGCRPKKPQAAPPNVPTASKQLPERSSQPSVAASTAVPTGNTGQGMSAAAVTATSAAGKKPNVLPNKPAKSSTNAPPPTDGKDASGRLAKGKEKSSDVRVAVLTPGGPLIVDVSLQIDGRRQQDVFEQLINGVLAAADTDHDKRLTWKELAANDKFLKEQQARNDPVPRRELKMWTDQYDRNHDGQVQRDEAAAWLGRAAVRRARAFSVRSSRSYFSVPTRILSHLEVAGRE